MEREVIELARFRTPPYVCSYIPSETATMESRVIGALTPNAYAGMLARGWRRFGYDFFRPACRNCVSCRSLRVLVNEFAPSRSQRRTMKENAAIELVVQAPTVSEQHLTLYRSYHAAMHSKRGWAYQEISKEVYRDTFLEAPGRFAREFLYFDAGRLVGVGLVDVLPEAISSVYFYHDPALRSRALGVLSLLRTLHFAQERGIRHHYLGYWVAECQSMAYKSNYRPHEILERYPDDCEEPVWVRPLKADGLRVVGLS